jgi:hypothetical protein
MSVILFEFFYTFGSFCLFTVSWKQSALGIENGYLLSLFRYGLLFLQQQLISPIDTPLCEMLRILQVFTQQTRQGQSLMKYTQIRHFSVRQDIAKLKGAFLFLRKLLYPKQQI